MAQSQQQIVAELLKRFDPLIAKAFLDAIYAARANVDKQAVIEALQAYDIERAIRLLRMEQATLAPLYEAVRAAYIASGQSVTAPRGLTGSFSFNGRHIRAEAWTAQIGSTLIQGIEEDTLVMARTVITKGLQHARPPVAIARDITGTLNRITGQREGGFLGLTAQQTDSIIAGRAKLASGNPDLMKEYLKLKQRNMLYDPMIRRAIAAGKPVTGADLEKIIAGHKSKALKYRGKMIAEHETFMAQAAGRDEAYRQMLDKPGVADVLERWQHNLSERPRLDHVAMNGTIISLRRGELFNFPDAAMKCPHDPVGGGKHSIGCRCIGVYFVKLETD